MSTTEKTTFGAIIEPRPTAPTNGHGLTPLKMATITHEDPVTPISARSFDPANPFDDSIHKHEEGYKSGPDNKTPARSQITDLESQRHLDLTRSKSSRSLDKLDPVWPSLKAQKARAKREKAARSCNPMARMGKKQKLIVSLVIALVIIGAAVGIGVGVSKAVGGGVSTLRGGSKPIGGGGDPEKRP